MMNRSSGILSIVRALDSISKQASVKSSRAWTVLRVLFWISSTMESLLENHARRNTGCTGLPSNISSTLFRRIASPVISIAAR